MLDALDEAADPADLGLGTRRYHHTGPLARGYQRSGECHAQKIAEGGARRDRLLLFLRYDRFAGQHGFLDEQATRAGQAQVGGHAVPRLEPHEVAGHEIGNRDAHAPAVAQDAGVRRDHLADRVQRLLRLAFLNEADDGIDQDDGDDHHRIDVVADQSGRDRRRQEEVDQRVVELPQEPPEAMGTGGRGQLVRTVGLEAPCRLL